MKEVAALAGEEPSDHPRTACAVATTFVLAAELFMDRDQQKQFREIVPVLKGSRNPKAFQARLEFLVERTVRKYALESLSIAGAHAAAAVIRDEPDTHRAASLAGEFAANLLADVPPKIQTAYQGRKLAAARACTSAAKTASNLREDDPTLRLNAANRAAEAIFHWAKAANNHSTVRETLALLRELVNLR